MGLMTLGEIRDDLMKESPEQWPVMLGLAESRIHNGESSHFKNLKEFVIGKVGSGGLGMTLEQAKSLLYFNPAYRHKADKLSRTMGLIELAKGVEALEEHGGEREQVDKSKDINLGGTSSTYRIAKLKRDHPDVSKRLEAGEFKTVSDAERAAGTRGRKMTPAEKAYRVIMRLTDDEREELNLLMRNAL